MNTQKKTTIAAYKEKDIVRETEHFWILRIKTGFEVYQVGITHSTRCAEIGFTGEEGLKRAVDECQRREDDLAAKHLSRKQVI